MRFPSNFLGFSEVIVLRVVQKTESNDLYPPHVPVLYELRIFFFNSSVDVGLHARMRSGCSWLGIVSIGALWY